MSALCNRLERHMVVLVLRMLKIKAAACRLHKRVIQRAVGTL